MKRFALMIVVLLVGGLLAGSAFASEGESRSASAGQSGCEAHQLDDATIGSLEAFHSKRVATASGGSCWWKHYARGCGTCTRNRRKGADVISEYWCWNGSLPELIFRGYSCVNC